MTTQKPKISIIGAGYVGLCTATAFATKGYTVIASDIDPEKAAKINQGIPPFHEPGLQEKLTQSIKNGTLKCLVNQTEQAVLETDLTYITVGTPSNPDGSINLQYIQQAAQDIGKALKNKNTYHLTIVKSTVTPGTTQNIVLPTLEKESKKQCSKHFGLCMNPEFLRQGSAFHDTLNADRIVIGSHDKKAGDTLQTLYQNFYNPKTPPIIRTTLATAELIKYASNAMLATKISFINTIANICEHIPGADITVVAQAMGLDKRIGPLFLDAGLGYGGSCFPKDIKALIACSKTAGYNPKLLQEVENVNKKQPQKAIKLCKKQLHNLKNKNIAILGLAFKPDTDDMREAPAIPIINQLLREGANVTAYDPAATQTAKTIFQNKIQYAPSAIDCLKNADCCIIVTEWPEFKTLTPENFTQNMRKPILIDGRRIYNPQTFKQKLNYQAIGLGN